MGDHTGTRGKKTSQCAGCGGAIHDQYILRVSPDLEWHAACLRCAECNQFLDDNCTCFVRDGKTYCKRDYARLFGAKCSKCSKLFSSTDMVMRARDKIFHIDCFRCCVCAKHLVPGDEFALRSEALYCRDDYDSKEQLEGSTGGGVTKLGAKSPAGDPGEENVQPKADKDQKKREGKTTRVRTVLNEKQLHTLRTCYNANPRPDALMKEQMVEMTALSPRVIRVWFQNKRCKDKKRQIYLRQMQEANKDGRRLSSMLPIQGIHMVASSPVRHDAANPMDGGLVGVDIGGYQPPWKALHEYALQGDIDPGTPQYQTLLSQMHGFGAELLPLPPPSGDPGCVGRPDPSLQPPAPHPVKYETDVGSDSYVSYLESDDSLHTSSP